MDLSLALWKLLTKGFIIFLSTTEFTYMSDIMIEVKLKHLQYRTTCGIYSIQNIDN